jgi:formate hydrogenlyase subunit 6/NADH:ubiquinone oxidoreductase subunit I
MFNYFRDIALGIVTILKSMYVACKHFFTPAVTLQYPTERWTMPERTRARLFNKIEDCIGCGQCARVCPTDCIHLQAEKRGKEEPEIFASNGTAIKMRTYVYDIDMTLCCYCALCTFSCPTHCLVMTGEYEYSVYDKAEHIHHFAKEKPLTKKALEGQSTANA